MRQRMIALLLGLLAAVAPLLPRPAHATEPAPIVETQVERLPHVNLPDSALKTLEQEGAQIVVIEVMAFSPPLRGVWLLWAVMGGLVLLVGAIYARRIR